VAKGQRGNWSAKKTAGSAAGGREFENNALVTGENLGPAVVVFARGDLVGDILFEE
jgi:hypothetical protein